MSMENKLYNDNTKTTRSDAHIKNAKESPRGFRLSRCSFSPQGGKYITVTQGTSPSDVADVSYTILFGSVKTGSLGHERKTGITRPRPGGGVKNRYTRSTCRHINDGQVKKKKMMRRPGIEPGSTAWKAAMLTTIPPT